MNILLLGSGGREHALAWKISQSSHCTHLFIAPGNTGTALCGTNVPIKVDSDFKPLEDFCRNNDVKLIIVGPEDPLVHGVYDFFKAAHMANPFGVGWLGVIAKEFMLRHQIPTANYKEFTADNFEEGKSYVLSHSLPIVLKADGLAAGKGVIICHNHIEAVTEYEMMIQHSKFGEAGKKVVVEEFLSGIEMSAFVLTDGKDFVVLPEAKDYKRIGEGDTGLNTGGMGAVSPVPFADEAFMAKVMERVIQPTISGLEKERIEYKGFVFFGLIKVGDEPFVIEYNCRMGDPETEVVMPRLKTDLVELLVATAKGDLKQAKVEQDPRFAVTVVAVSGGYPGNFAKGYEIEGLDEKTGDSLVFHAGTAIENDKIVTNGGRVLTVTSFGKSISEAADYSKYVLEGIHFTKMYFRKDIGWEFE
jgi:phosphoribosylamine---glycine ligase